MPGQVALDRLLHLFKAVTVRRPHGKLLEPGEVAFDAVEPGGVGGREAKLDVVCRDPGGDFHCETSWVVVRYNIQALGHWVLRPHPLEEIEPLHAGFALGEKTVE